MYQSSNPVDQLVSAGFLWFWRQNGELSASRSQEMDGVTKTFPVKRWPKEYSNAYYYDVAGDTQYSEYGLYEGPFTVGDHSSGSTTGIYWGPRTPGELSLESTVAGMVGSWQMRKEDEPTSFRIREFDSNTVGGYSGVEHTVSAADAYWKDDPGGVYKWYRWLIPGTGDQVQRGYVLEVSYSYGSTTDGGVALGATANVDAPKSLPVELTGVTITTPETGGVRVSWNKPTDPLVLGYHITWRRLHSNEYAWRWDNGTHDQRTKITDLNVTSFDIPNANPSLWYQIRVAPVLSGVTDDAVNWQPWDIGVPGAESLGSPVLTAVAKDGAVEVSWATAPPKNVSVKVYRQGKGVVYIQPAPTTTFVDTDVVNGTAYSYQANYISAAGEATTSNVVTATPMSGAGVPGTSPATIPYLDDPGSAWPGADPGGWDTNGGVKPPGPTVSLTGTFTQTTTVSARAELLVVGDPIPTPDYGLLRSPALPDYTFYLCDLGSGDVIEELPLSGVTYGHVLNAPGALRANLSLRDSRATPELLREGERSIVVSRNGQVVWGGPLWATRVSADSHSVELACEGFWSLVRRRHLRDTQTFTNTDLFGIVRTLMAYTDSYAPPNSDTGILVPAGDRGVTQTATYYAHELPNVAGIIETLAAGSPGFEFYVEVSYSGGKIVRTLRLDASAGRTYPNSGLVWELGVNLRGLDVTRDATRKATTVTAIGAGDGPSTLLASAGTAASTGEPILEAVTAYKDVTARTHLSKLAARDLAAYGATMSISGVKLDPLYPGTGIGNFGLGDEGLLLARQGAFINVAAKHRIVAYDVALSDDRAEELTLSLAPTTAFGG